MIRILTIKSELKSAQGLGFETAYYYENYTSHFQGDVVIRWGNSNLHYKGPDSSEMVEFDNVINSSKAIRKNCQKNRVLSEISAVVKTPKMFLGKVPEGKKVVYRTFEHSHGRGFSVKTGPFDIEFGHYATEFIETEEEYRVWFCGKKTFCAQRVALTKKDTAEFPCRSNWGYRYCETVPETLRRGTLDAAKIIGLEIGAADVLFHNNEYYFLELNSAPTVDTGRLKTFYRKGIKSLVKEKFPQMIV